MKGLLRKEYYNLGGIIIPICIAVTLIATLIFNLRALSIGWAVIAATMPISLFSADTKAHWWTYSKTLPYARSQIVDAKYLTELFFIAVPVLFQLLMNAANLLLHRDMPDFQSLPYLIFFFCCYAAALLFPLMFWEKRHGIGWLSGIAVSIILFAAILPLLVLIPTFAIFESAARNEAVKTTFYFFGTEYTLNEALPVFRRIRQLLPPAGILLYGLSWLLSRRIYRRRKRRCPA